MSGALGRSVLWVGMVLGWAFGSPLYASSISGSVFFDAEATIEGSGTSYDTKSKAQYDFVTVPPLTHGVSLFGNPSNSIALSGDVQPVGWIAGQDLFPYMESIDVPTIDLLGGGSQQLELDTFDVETSSPVNLLKTVSIETKFQLTGIHFVPTGIEIHNSSFRNPDGSISGTFVVHGSVQATIQYFEFMMAGLGPYLAVGGTYATGYDLGGSFVINPDGTAADIDFGGSIVTGIPIVVTRQMAHSTVINGHPFSLDFTLTMSPPVGVPEPGAIVMLLIGLPASFYLILRGQFRRPS